MSPSTSLLALAIAVATAVAGCVASEEEIVDDEDLEEELLEEEPEAVARSKYSPPGTRREECLAACANPDYPTTMEAFCRTLPSYLRLGCWQVCYSGRLSCTVWCASTFQ